LNNKFLIFIYLDRNTNKIDSYEVSFKPTFFQHLTGTITNLSKRNFYNKALNNTLKITDFEYKDNNTYLKLDNIIKGMEISKYARMIGDFIGNRKYLALTKIAGTQYLAIGFDETEKYNYPKTLLVGDIRRLTTSSPNRILCILSKREKTDKYKEIVYIAKDIEVEKLKFDKNLINKIEIKDSN